MQAQWGCLIRLELGQNPREELGQNARSQSECLQHAVGLVLWESSRLAEQPRSSSANGPAAPGEGSRAVLLLGSSTLPRRKNRRKRSVLDTACSVVLGSV